MYIVEKARQTEIAGTYDVIVARLIFRVLPNNLLK